MAGVIDPGDPASGPGMLTIDGEYAQHSEGTLEIHVGQNEHGALVVDGTASLAGGLNVTLLESAALTPGESLDILTADSVTGLFDEDKIELPKNWSIGYLRTRPVAPRISHARSVPGPGHAGAG